MTTPGKPAFGAGALRYPQIFSPNFNVANPSASPAQSWALYQNGLAYLFGLILTGGTLFDYSPSPGLGNLVLSVAGTGGTDAYGNAYLPGVTVYQDVGGATPFQAVQVNGQRITFYGATSAAGPWTWRGNMWMPGAGKALQVSFPEVVFQSTTSSDIIIGGSLTLLAPSGDTTGATDLANITAALGGKVQLLPGDYYINGPVNIPPYTVLEGLAAPMTLALNSSAANAPRIIAVSTWAPSSSTGMVQFLSETPGGWGVPAASQTLRNIILDGSQNASTNLQLINMTGPVFDVHVEDVMLFQGPHDGVTASAFTEAGIGPTFPFHARFERVTAAYCGFAGFNLVNFTDSDFIQCLAFQNASNGFTLQNNSNSRLAACRSEWNTGRGYDISGASGSIVLDGCSTDQNLSEGLRVNAATGQASGGGGVVWSGGKLHSDGHGGTNNNGIKVTGSSTVPVVICGTNIEVGQPAAGTFYPATALDIDSGSTNVLVSGCMLQGVTSAWTSAGTLVARSGCIGATGNPGAQTFTRLADT